MCLAVPGKVESIDFPFATVDFNGTKKKVRIDLLDDLKVGDYVLVHVGFAIQKMDEEDVKELENIWKQVLETEQ
jgi:hydrogenase expression/formation protein HypC